MRPTPLGHTARLACAPLLAACLASALAQGPPELPEGWFPNRVPSTAQQALYACLDEREPGHLVDREIAEAIAGALLLDTEIVLVGRTQVVELDYEPLYIDLVDRCILYLGFRLYAETYPEWLTFTSNFYEARFVVLTRQGGPRRLADLPPGAAVGAVQGTMGDIRFLLYNNGLPTSSRWQRVPLGAPPLALAALLDGRVQALVIWEPWWWWLARSDPELSSLQVMEAEMVSEPWIGVGGALTSDRVFPRSQIDEALAVLHRDGVIGEILERWGFPGRVR